MKLLMMLDTPFWVILTTCLVVYILSLRKRMAGLDNPKLYLSRGERRAWAREQLREQAKQDKEDRDAAQLARDLEFINNPKGNPL